MNWRFILGMVPRLRRMWKHFERSVKNCLRNSIIGKAFLKLDKLKILFVEVECIINSRLVTYVYDDTDGILYPLTPPQLLCGSTVTLQPNDKHVEIVRTNQSSDILQRSENRRRE